MEVKYKQDSQEQMKYDAFVSYKHGEIDSKAAEAVQKNLEHFRVPKSLKNCKEKIERVFVDEGELSSSSYFSQVIRDALKNAEWLIVICSKETKYSEWVNLEIRTFLEFHDRSKILAVITEGEPREVYPEALLGKSDYEDEVLAADARGTNAKEVQKKLKKDALLKIAAPILGTSFDSLKQRRKTYVMQRAAITALILLVLVTGFSVYAIRQARLIARQAVQLNEEYEKGFVSQAKYMTEIARNELENDNHAVAVETVLQVLPEKEGSQPVLAESLHIIAEALNLYRTEDSMDDTMTPTGTFRLGDISKEMESEYRLDESGNYLFTADSDNLYVWDTKTCNVKSVFSPGGAYGAKHILVSGKSWILVAKGAELYCYNYETEEVEWKRGFTQSISTCTVSDSGEITILVTENEIIVLNTETGKTIQSVRCLEKVSHEMVISKDDKWMATGIQKTTEAQLEDEVEYQLLLYDVQNNTYEKLPQKYEYVKEIKFVGEDALCIVSGKGVTAIFRSAHTLETTYEKLYAQIGMYHLEEREFVWENEMTYAESSGDIGLGIIDEKVVFTLSDRALVLDKESGNILDEYEFETKVVETYGLEDGFAVVTENGELISIIFGEEKWWSSKYFVDKIQDVSRRGTNYYIQRMDETDTIIKYEYEIADENFEELYKLEEKDGTTIELAENGYVVYWESDTNLCVVNGKEAKKKIIQMRDKYYCDIIGFADAYRKLVVIEEEEDGGNRLCVVDIDNEKVDEYVMNSGNSSYVLGQSVRLLNDQIYYGIETEKSSIEIYSMDIENGEEKLLRYHELDRENLYETFEHNSFSISDFGDYVCFFTSAYVDNEEFDQRTWLVIMDLKNGNTVKRDVTEYGLNPEETPQDGKKGIAWSNSGAGFALRDNQKMIVIDVQGKKLCEIAIGENVIDSFSFTPDDNYLLTLEEESFDYYICEYDLESQKMINRIETDTSLGYRFGGWERVEDSIMVLYSNIGNTATIFDADPNTFGVISFVEHCANYSREEDCFYITHDDWLGTDNLQIGKFRRYTTDEIIKKGREFVGQTEN